MFPTKRGTLLSSCMRLLWWCYDIAASSMDMKPWLQLHCVFRVVANEMQHSKAQLVKGVLRGDSYSYSSQQTWDVPRPVRFDSDVRKRVYCRSQQIGSHESNSGRWHRGVTTYSPCCWHSPANRIPKGRTEKGETDRPFTVADLSATSGGAPRQRTRVASCVENNR